MSHTFAANCNRRSVPFENDIKRGPYMNELHRAAVHYVYAELPGQASRGSLVALVLFLLVSTTHAQDFDQWITHQGFHSYNCGTATIPANGQLEELDFDTAFPLTTDTWLYNASGDYILTNPNAFAVPFTELFTIYVGGYPFPTYVLYSVTKTLQIEANSVGQQFDYHGITSYPGNTYPGPYGTEDLAIYVAVPSVVGGRSVKPLGCVRIEDFTTENNCNKNYPTLGGC